MIKKNNYITPEGYQKLVDEHNQLLKVERPEICRVIAWAAGNGDRSENADYIYGKKRLREIDRRLRFLNKRIQSAMVVDPESIDAEDIKFGATVTVMDEDENHTTYVIVGVDEIDLSKKYISHRSPIGMALLGRVEGEILEINIPKGLMEVEIIRIEYKKIIF